MTTRSPTETPSFGRGSILLLVALVLVLSFGVGIFDHGIWSPTEPAVSGVVWNMVEHGDLAVPRINDQPYLEKPPLYYWLAALACRVSGSLDEGWIRLPAALAGVLCLLLVHGTAKRRYGPRVAAMLTLLAATCVPFVAYAHRAAADILAYLFAYLAFAIYLRTVPGEGEPEGGTVWLDLAFAATVAVSFYAKSFLTALVVVPPVVIHLAWRRRFRRILLIGVAGVALTAAFVAPWAIALHRAADGWEYVRIVFVDNVFGRFFDLSAEGIDLGPLNDAYTVERGKPIYYYLPLLPLVVAPWTLAFLGGLVGLFRRGRRGEYPRFLLIAVVTVPVVLSLSSSKAQNYLDTVGLVCFLVVGDLIHRVARERERAPLTERIAYVSNLVVGLLFVVAVPTAVAVLSGALRDYGVVVLAALAASALVLRFRREILAPRAAFALGAVLAATLVASSVSAIGLADELRSHGTFFVEHGEEFGDHPVATTLMDDRRLPSVTYYLRRRVRYVRGARRAAELLGAEPDIRLILPEHIYDMKRPLFEGVPHVVRRSIRGRADIVLIRSP